MGNIARDFHCISFEMLAKARASSFRPFPPKRRYLDISFGDTLDISKESIRKAIVSNITAFLDPPAKLLGIQGVQKFSREILKWKLFDDEKLKRTCITNYFMINEKGGTGGGAFRTMYSDFLLESSEFMSGLKECASDYEGLGRMWDSLADVFLEIYDSCKKEHIDECSDMLKSIYSIEKASTEKLLNICG